MEKKYKLTKENISYCGKTLYRIEALKDFANVKKGDKGGYIKKENNLSQEGNCWIYDNAKVYENAKVCGNATRCVAFYLSRKLNKSKIKIKSGGIVLKSIVYPQNKTQANVLTKWNSAKILKSKGNKFLVYCGNLHLVIFVKNFNFDVEKCGKKLNIQTKNKVNIEFVKIKKENELQVKVYERGSGITYACGSGAIASAVAYLNNKEKDKKIKIFLDGGELYIYQHNKKIFMRGKANIVYKGETNLDEFC